MYRHRWTLYICVTNAAKGGRTSMVRTNVETTWFGIVTNLTTAFPH